MKKISNRVVACIAIVLVFSMLGVPAERTQAAIPNPMNAYWQSGYTLPGLNWVVSAVAHDGTTIYAAGDFDTAGGARSSRIAKWDGTRWVSISSNTDGSVYTLEMVNGVLYVGGAFDNIGGISARKLARYTGSAWESVSGGVLDGGVMDIVYDSTKNDLYIAGYFNNVGPSNLAAKGIARLDFDNSTWYSVGGGLSSGSGYALEYDEEVAGSYGYIYFGGTFSQVGGTSADNIGRYDTRGGAGAWTALGSGLDDDVLTLEYANNTIYAGGRFLNSGTTSIKNIAQWDSGTSQWVALGSGTNDEVYAMKALSGKLYVGGEFTQIGAASYSGLAAWSFSGSTWAEVEGGVGGYVYDIDAYTSGLTEHVLVGGEFGHVGGNTVVQAANIADRVKDSFLGSRWRRLIDPDGPGAEVKGYNQRVTALLRDLQGNLYMGGCTEPGGLVDGIGRWDGTRWVPLGSGLTIFPGCVTAMAIGPNDTLYAAGEFDAATVRFRIISRWTGTTWNEIAIDIDGTINAMVVGQDGTLYVGGDFSSINGTNEISSRLIQYSSSGSWSNVGSVDITNSVRSLAISKTTGDLYVGGTFTTIGALTVNRIARWDGSTWSALGTGLGGTSSGVYTIAIDSSGRGAAQNASMRAGLSPRRAAAARATSPIGMEPGTQWARAPSRAWMS